MVVNNIKYERLTNVLSENCREKLLLDVKKELKENTCLSVPPIQTYPDLVKKFYHEQHWKNLIENIYFLVERYFNKNLNTIQITSGWANLSNENNQYNFHTHSCECTLVYYLVSALPEYGTNLVNEIILPSIENSLVIFDGKIEHSVVNMPKELGKKFNRISLAFNVNVENFSQDTIYAVLAYKAEEKSK